MQVSSGKQDFFMNSYTDGINTFVRLNKCLSIYDRINNR